jgi:hypothetical protein
MGEIWVRWMVGRWRKDKGTVAGQAIGDSRTGLRGGERLVVMKLVTMAVMAVAAAATQGPVPRRQQMWVGSPQKMLPPSGDYPGGRCRLSLLCFFSFPSLSHSSPAPPHLD